MCLNTCSMLGVYITSSTERELKGRLFADITKGINGGGVTSDIMASHDGDGWPRWRWCFRQKTKKILAFVVHQTIILLLLSIVIELTIVELLLYCASVGWTRHLTTDRVDGPRPRIFGKHRRPWEYKRPVVAGQTLSLKNHSNIYRRRPVDLRSPFDPTEEKYTENDHSCSVQFGESPSFWILQACRGKYIGLTICVTILSVYKLSTNRNNDPIIDFGGDGFWSNNFFFLSNWFVEMFVLRYSPPWFS